MGNAPEQKVTKLHLSGIKIFNQMQRGDQGDPPWCYSYILLLFYTVKELTTLTAST